MTSRRRILAISLPGSTESVPQWTLNKGPNYPRSAHRSRGRRKLKGNFASIPFFVRGKARRNTERYATERGVAMVTVETLYDAKAHYAR